VGATANCKRQSTLSLFSVPGFCQGDDYDATARFLVFTIFSPVSVCLTNPINNPGQLFVFHVWRVCGPETFEISMNFKLKLSGYEIGGKRGESGGYRYDRRGWVAWLSASISSLLLHSSSGYSRYLSCL